jgi:hypothetical protein
VKALSGGESRFAAVKALTGGESRFAAVKALRAVKIGEAAARSGFTRTHLILNALNVTGLVDVFVVGRATAIEAPGVIIAAATANFRTAPIGVGATRGTAGETIVLIITHTFQFIPVG